MLKTRNIELLKQLVIRVVTTPAGKESNMTVVYLDPQGVIYERSYKEHQNMPSVIDRIDPKSPSREDLIELSRELESLKDVDIRTVDKASLVDIGDVHINMDLPMLERTINYIKQVRNPYCYKIHGVVVKTNFMGTVSIDECLEAALYGGGTSKI